MPPPEPKRRGRPRKDRGPELASSGHTSGKATKKVRFIDGYYDKDKREGDGDDDRYRDLDDEGKDDKGDDNILRKNLEECDDYVDVSKISLV